MKKILLLNILLAFSFAINAQTIDSVSTTSPILCNGGTGDITVYTNAANFVVYDVFTENQFGAWQPYSNGLVVSSNPDILLNNLFSGNYMIRTYGSGGLLLDSIEHFLLQPQPLVLTNSTSSPASCFNGDDGTASVSVIGGTMPYSYDWDDANAQTTATATDLLAGSYNCLISDTNNCPSTSNPVNIIVTQPLSSLNVSSSLYTQINVNCFGDSTGGVVIYPSGGTTPYSYNWLNLPIGNNGSSSSQISSLPAGSYQVVVTDDNGCTEGSFNPLANDTTTYTITQPLSPISVQTTITNVICKNGSTGNVTLTPSGGNAPSGAYSYLWSSGQTTQSINNLTAGFYTYTVTDANGCILTNTIEITEPNTLLTSLTSSNPVLCHGGSTGTISVSVGGGHNPYTYIWDNGVTVSSYSGVTAGTYNVSITDSLGCNITDSLIVTEPTPISNYFTGDSISCPFGNDGELSSNASGGTAPYNYFWSSPNPNFSLLGQGSATITQLQLGSYTVVIDDDNGCSSTHTYLLGSPDQINISATTTNVECYGGNTGEIITNIIGATPPYTYVWDNGQTTSSISSLNSGTYTVTVQDDNGCYGPLGNATVSFIVTEIASAPISVTADLSDVICHGDANGTATLSPSGGTSPYTYLWNTGETVSSRINLPVGQYTVLVEDFYLCEHTIAFNIDEPNPITLVESYTDPQCNGYSDGTASVVASGGYFPYTYLWSTGHTGPSVNQLAPGPISVTVTDSSSQCNASVFFQIGEPSPIVVSVTTIDNLCFGYSTGSANSQVSDPGNAPFTYLWSTGETTPNIATLSAGTYDLIVTNADGCQQDAFYLNGDPNTSTSFDITEPNSLTLNPLIYPISVTGANDGSISVSPAGGVAPYSYSWTWSGSINYTNTNATINNLSPGYYYLQVADASGCIDTDTFLLNEPNCNLTINSTYLPPLCNDSNAQLFQWTVSGGVAPFVSELIDNNGTVWYGPNSGNPQPTFNGTLPPGFYTLNVSDQAGCLQTMNLSVVAPTPIDISFNGVDLDCFGDNSGSLSAIASGGTPFLGNTYTYLWSPNNQTSFNISNLTAGTYSVIVTDDNNCQKVDTFTINQPSQLLVDSITSNYISCNPGIDGQASVFSSGGTQPYTYLWTIPNSGIPQTTQTASNLSSAGLYSVTITDNNGCNINDNVNVSNAPNLILTDSVIQPLCYNDTNGMIYANISGGTSPYTYNWSINGLPNSYSTNSFIANLGPSMYSVIVEDNYGCIGQFSQQIINPSQLNIALSPINVSLNGANDGSISSIVSGGTGPGTYSYLWNGPNGYTSTSANISNLYAGIYTLVIVDGNGCSTTFFQEINEPACNLYFDTTITYVSQPLCFGQAGSITWMASGGGQSLNTTISNNVTGTVYYSLSNPPNIIPPPQYLFDGSYNIQVVDEYGCSDILNFQILAPNLLSANITTDSVSCFGGNDGSMLLEGIGGTAPYYPNYGTAPITGIPVNQNQLTAGTYIVSLTDDNGCSSFPSFFQVEIFEPNQLTVSYTTSPVTCYGGIDGDINLSVSGGTGAYTYIWTPPSGAPYIPSTPTVSGVTANTYFVEVTDANGCSTNPGVITINVPGPSNNLLVSANVTDVECFGGNNGSAQALPTGGTAPYSYEWQDGQTNQTATGLTIGSYICIVTDANGCTNSIIATVDQPNQINVNLSTTPISCFGLNDGSATVNPTGGSGNGFAVVWNIVNPLTFTNYTSLSVPNISIGQYLVTVTDLSLPNSCAISEVVLMTQPDILQITPNVEQIVVCFDDATGSLSASSFGGTAPYTYNWSSILNNSVATTALASNLSSQMYYVTATDANGCSISDSIFLGSNSQLFANISFDNVSCFGGNDGIAYSNPNGGTAPYTFNWSFTGSTSSSSTGLSASNPYSVSVTDNNGCPSTDTIFFVPQPNPISMFVTIDSVSCAMGTDGQINIDSIIGGAGGYTYLWSNGQTTDSATNLMAGSYTCVVTDYLGCIDSSNSFTVSEPNHITANIIITTNYNGSNISCIGLNDGSATASATGGTGSFNYLWSNGDTTPFSNNLSAGTYSVIVTDINGCNDSTSIALVNPDTIHFNYTVNNISCNGFSDGDLNVNISGGSGIDFSTLSWTYNGNPIPSNPIPALDTSLYNLLAGTYTVTVADSNGCTASSSVVLTEPNVLSNFFTTDSVTCNGGSDGSVYANVSGGTAPYDYGWISPISSDSSSAHNLIANTNYQVNISDANSCILLSANVQVLQPDPISLTTILTTPTCYGINDGGLIINSVSGGTGGYTFLWSDGQTGTTMINLYGDSLYSCLVTDAIGCIDTSYSVFLSQPDSLVALISILTNYNGTDVECYGDTNASVLSSVSGGTAPFSYSWNTGDTTDLLDSTGAGFYVVNITDTFGCQDLDTITILNPDPILITYTVSNYNGSNISCTDSSDGFIITNISGGNGIDPSLTVWDGPNNFASINTSIDSLDIGSYQLFVSDFNGCVDSVLITLTQPDPILTNYTVDSITCYGGSDGSAYVNPSGGTTPYSISWSDLGIVTNSIHGLDTTSVWVQIEDANNCPMGRDTFNIPQPDSILTTHSITLPTCFGVADGAIALLSITGATGPYTYLWNDALSSTGTIVSNLTSGEYICTITDAIGCSEDVLFLVDTVFAVEASAIITTTPLYNGADVACYGDTNSAIQAIATGGTEPYTYNWTSGQNTDSIYNIGAGIYTVHIVDSNGCHDFYSVTVNNPDSLIATILTSDYNGFEISCDGLSDGEVTASVSGGNVIDFNTLLWGGGQTTLNRTALNIGTYYYSIQDNNGCIASDTVVLYSPPLMQLSLSADTLLCYADANANAYINVLNNGILPFNYLWSDGQITDSAFNLNSGFYDLTITDDNNCSVNSSVEVIEPDALVSLLSITSSSSYNGYDISCFGASDGSVSVSTIGGISPYLYSLDSIYFSNTSNYNSLAEGVFNLITRDNNGCVITNDIILSSPNLLEANLQVLANPTCNGINDGVITSLTSGGTGIYSYTWSSNFSTTNIINSLSVGLYNVIVSDNNGCTISDSILLDPVYTLNDTMTSTQVTCTGSSDGTATITMLGGTSPYTYQWDNGLSTATITGLFAGDYIVTVTDVSGCILIDTVEVTESDSVLAVTAIVSDLSCFQDNSGSILVSVSGGTGAYNYSWSNGETTSLISNLNAATYQLDVSDAAGCIVSNSFIVSEPLNLVYTLSSEDITCFGLSDGFTNIAVSGGILPYNYDWSGPANYASTDTSIDFLSQGSYSIIVTDANNCFVTDSVFISEPTALVSVVDYSDPLCFNSSDGSIDINVHGGIGPYTSSFGLFSPTVILPDSIFYQNLSSGSNILSVIDANNCENSYTITLINPLELIIDNISTSSPSCYNYSNGAASINVIGGILPYTYQLLDNNNNLLTGSSNSSDLSSGSYQYLVTDQNGCDDTLSFNINNVDEISINPSSIIDVNCYGENTGSVEVNISNANGSYELVWMPNQSNTNSELITDLSAGKYTAVVVDELGCTKIDSFFVNENENIEVDFTAINSSCKLNADGQININNIIGGVGPFSIYNNSDLVASNIFDSYTIESLITTDDISPYNLVVLDNYNCQFNTSVNIGFDGGYGCIDEPIIITPNYDGYNDTWIPILDLNTDIEVSILNRWGEKEYRYIGNSLSFSWNGLANWGKDHQLPSSDYYYIIEFTNDNYPAKTGVITLIR